MVLELFTDEGWEVDEEDSLWRSTVHLWRKRLSRIKNKINHAIYPVPLAFLYGSTVLILSLQFAGANLPLHRLVLSHLPQNDVRSPWIACLIVTSTVWFISIFFVRGFLKLLLSYKGWLKEQRGGRKSVSLQTKLWLVCLKLVTCFNKPRLYSYQGVLPRLPVPSVERTVQRYLESVKPLLTETQYDQVAKMAQEFKNGISSQLQRQLTLKSWWSKNYVTDWWEEYAYLRSRSPLMINSNFYAFDCLKSATKNQAARAATFIYCTLQFRRRIERNDMEPVMAQGLIPLCMSQVSRVFNTCRVPGEEVDKLVHYTYSKHIVVYHKGRYFKVPIYYNRRLLKPSEIEIQLNCILQDTSKPAIGEEKLAALTAGQRTAWAKTRNKYFAEGINKTSLDLIEKAAFFVALDDFPYEYNEVQDDPVKLETYARALFHGKGYDRWFDKSTNFCFGTDGRLGLNAEHSWADGGISSLMFEYTVLDEALEFGYTAEGHCLGTPEFTPPIPTRLQWDLPTPALTAIDQASQEATVLINGVDLKVHIYRKYGKGFMKKCKVSPDAYLQMALQLTYFRDIGKFGLTYESGTTRLYQEGRTETVRSCTDLSCTWVRAMDDNTVSVDEKIQLLRKACQHHQRKIQDVMCGEGVDRHLFCLYLVSRHLQLDSTFLKEVMNAPWLLSTSQTPHGQTSRADLHKYPGVICGGGGFAPTADDGYGVSYIFGGEDLVFLHISSYNSSKVTDTTRFVKHLLKALGDMQNLFKD